MVSEDESVVFISDKQDKRGSERTPIAHGRPEHIARKTSLGPESGLKPRRRGLRSQKDFDSQPLAKEILQGVEDVQGREKHETTKRRERKAQPDPSPFTTGSPTMIQAATSPPTAFHQLGNESPIQATVRPLPSTLTTAVTSLSKRDLEILRKKQHWLQTHQPPLPPTRRRSSYSQTKTTAAQAAIAATLIFAQQDAGTAVCISPSGLMLTCAHCIAESEAVFTKTRQSRWWLLFASGRAIAAECLAWDGRRDLALLHIVGAQHHHHHHRDLTSGESADSESLCPFPFPFLSLHPAPGPQLTNTPILCIGQPGAEDLETPTPGTALLPTGYDVLHVSSGALRGYAPGHADVHDNSEIGALRHDAWTYWGHSGAPLVAMVVVDASPVDDDRVVAIEGGGLERGGEVRALKHQRNTKTKSRVKTQVEVEATLVGLHSSWDEETGMRRGIGWQCIRAFLDEHRAQIEAWGEKQKLPEQE